jgi:hypothetical protein
MGAELPARLVVMYSAVVVSTTIGTVVARFRPVITVIVRFAARRIAKLQHVTHGIVKLLPAMNASLAAGP